MSDEKPISPADFLTDAANYAAITVIGYIQAPLVNPEPNQSILFGRTPDRCASVSIPVGMIVSVQRGESHTCVDVNERPAGTMWYATVVLKFPDPSDTAATAFANLLALYSAELPTTTNAGSCGCGCGCTGSASQPLTDICNGSYCPSYAPTCYRCGDSDAVCGAAGSVCCGSMLCAPGYRCAATPGGLQCVLSPGTASRQSRRRY
jgi:hypothetical protein